MTVVKFVLVFMSSIQIH